jgi:hyperosmotically inducible periplasmic protein
MKSTLLITAAIVCTLATGCDRPGTRSAYNTAASPAQTVPTANKPTNPAQTMDNTSPNTPASTAMSASNATSSTAATGAASSNVVTDTVVTGKVKTAITADNGMKDADISVRTENGVVTLTGSVKSPEQVTLAAALAQRQEGVSRVENQVAVK